MGIPERGRINFTVWHYLLLVCLLLIGPVVKAQGEGNVGSWMVVSGENRVTEKWSVPTVFVLRHYETFQENEFAFLRTGISLKISKTQSISVGPAYLNSRLYETEYNRNPSQQFWLYTETTLNSPINQVKVSNRLRWESRWINLKETKKYDSRVRYRLQFQRPISKTLYLKSFDELFYSFSGQEFNQNRFYFGLGYSLSKELKFETGYLKLHLGSQNSDRFRMAFLFRTNLSKNYKHKR